MSKKKKTAGTRAQRAAQQMKPFVFDAHYDVAVIGGGASGLACALACAQQAQRLGVPVPRIIVLEKGRRIGASILRSGNGRCNFSNAQLDVSRFQNAPFVGASLAALDDCDLIAPGEGSLVIRWFEALGLVWQEAPGTGGLLYPYSNKASSILEVLQRNLDRYGIDLRTNVSVEQVEHCESGYTLHLSEVSLPSMAKAEGEAVKRKTASITASHVVMAAGGGFDSALLSDCSIPALHPWRPTLGPLAAEFPEGVSGAELDGLRVQACISIPGGNFFEQGEVLFRPYGISGIVVFNASRYAQPGMKLLIDFMPEQSESDLREMLQQRTQGFTQTNQELFSGFLLPELAHALCAAARVNPESTPTAQSIKALARVLKEFSCTVQDVADEKQCQVHRGGVPVAAVNAATLESHDSANLYVLGEALDVDGPCGGYNLHWAWACGILSGCDIARKLSKEHPC